MREIKFRAWHAELGMSEVFGLETDLEAFPEAIMQYTGLKDKNGKEIYEGDIIHLFGKGHYDGVDYNGCIQFLDGGFCATDGYKEYGLRRYDLSRCDLEVEVIGNIYENPELLD